MSQDKRIDFNTRERLVSEDFNRLQTFRTAALSDVVRLAMGGPNDGSVANGGPAGLDFIDGAVGPAASNGYVLNGLFVVVDNPAGVLITRGSAGFWVHDWSASADASDYVLVPSDGVSVLADLPFVANAGASTRWDQVIAYVEDEEVLEQSNRDIYDPATRTFTPALVNKVTAPRLKFAYVTGVIGDPIPAPPAAGSYGVKQCVPIVLALVCVHPWSTGFDNCDVYDTRPLVRARTMDIGRVTIPVGREGVWKDRSLSTQALWDAPAFFNTIQGMALAAFGEFDIGGRIMKATPAPTLAQFGVVTNPALAGYDSTNVGGDSLFVDPNDPDLEDTNLAPSVAADALNLLALLRPSGYDRFVRYNQGPAVLASLLVNNALHPSGVNGRRPIGPNGVFLVLGNGAGYADGQVSTVGGSAAFNSTFMTGLVVTTLMNNAAGSQRWAPRVTSNRHEWPMLVEDTGTATIAGGWFQNTYAGTELTAYPNNSSRVAWEFLFGQAQISGGGVPKNARWAWFRFSAVVLVNAPTNVRVDIKAGSTLAPAIGVEMEGMQFAGTGVGGLAQATNVYQDAAGGVVVGVDVRVPVNHRYTYGVAGHAPTWIEAIIQADAAGSITNVNDAKLYLMGFED